MKRRTFLGGLIGAVVAPIVVARQADKTLTMLPDLDSAMQIKVSSILTPQDMVDPPPAPQATTYVEMGNEPWNSAWADQGPPKQHPNSPRRKRRAAARERRRLAEQQAKLDQAKPIIYMRMPEETHAQLVDFFVKHYKNNPQLLS